MSLRGEWEDFLHVYYIRGGLVWFNDIDEMRKCIYVRVVDDRDKTVFEGSFLLYSNLG